MSHEIRYVATDYGLNAIVKGKAYSIPRDHSRWDDLQIALQNNNSDSFVDLVDFSGKVRNYVNGLIQVIDGVLYANDRPVNTVLANRTLLMMEKGIAFDYMFRFIENVMNNSSRRATEELFPFMIKKQHSNGREYAPLPITEDGFLLAYKSLNNDYTDCHTSTVDNTPPKRDANGELLSGEEPRIISMPRNEADEDFGVDCSEGFHVGSLSYVSTFGHSDRKIVIVKVNPKDVVSVPSNENCVKCRVCSYEVLCDFTGELKAPVYSSSGYEEIEPVPAISSSGPGRSNEDPIDDSSHGAWSKFYDEDEEDSYDSEDDSYDSEEDSYDSEDDLYDEDDQDEDDQDEDTEDSWDSTPEDRYRGVAQVKEEPIIEPEFDDNDDDQPGWFDRLMNG